MQTNLRILPARLPCCPIRAQKSRPAKQNARTNFVRAPEKGKETAYLPRCEARAGRNTSGVETEEARLDEEEPPLEERDDEDDEREDGDEEEVEEEEEDES